MSVELKDLNFLFEVKNDVHLANWSPLMDVLKAKGARVDTSNSGEEYADVGFYCSDNPIPKNQRLTAVMLNGLDQDHVIRPNYSEFFLKENWRLFDVGFLPGGNWTIGYSRIIDKSKVSPKFGVFEVGWPKSDPIFEPVDPIIQRANKHFISKILYASQIEWDGKQKTLVSNLRGQKVKLKIKHWETKEHKKIHPWLITDSLLDEINNSNEEIMRSDSDWVEIADPKSNFISIMQDCDLLITDQSSVLYEALLCGIPTLAVYDWRHACGECPGPKPSPDICFYTSSGEIKEAVAHINENYKYAVELAIKKRDKLFVNLGKGSQKTLEIILDIFNNNFIKPLKYKPSLKKTITAKPIRV